MRIIMSRARSVDLVEEVDELLEVYFVAGLNSCNFYHCCTGQARGTYC